MITLLTLLGVLVHLGIALLVPPLLLGLIGKVKALAGGRVGPPVLQPWRDLIRLLQKGSVFSRTTTWIFRAGPVIGVVTVLLALALMPLGSHRAPLAFGGDVLVFAGLLGLGRFFTVLAALDTGSSFEGMGATREATFSALAEPGLFLGLMVLVRHASGPSLNLMLSAEDTARAWSATPGALLMVAVSFFVLLLVENSRIPVDDPGTHLELTMIHEVMVLDHSGPALGLIHYGAALKLFVFGALVVNVALPYTTGSTWADWGVFLGAMAALAVGVGVLESTMARLRLLHVPRLLVASSILSVFGIILGS